jgi:hypothetical protein
MFDSDLKHLSRISRLIDDMLDITRIREGNLTFIHQKVEFSSLAKDVVERFRPQTDAVGSFLSLNSCAQAMVEIDSYRIEQVIVNLLSNAMKYGAGKPIHVDIVKYNKLIQLMVHDQGPGIKKEDKDIKLKEYIKELVRKGLDEESTSGDAGAYLTPKAFSPKGQGKNAATTQAVKSGWKLAGGMPKNSKVYDYKELWKGKKSAMNENTDFKIGDKVKYENQEWEVENILSNGLIRLKNLKGLPSTNVIPSKIEKLKESDYDKASLKGQASGYTAASGYTTGGIKGDDYYKKESMKESLINIIEKELINEVTYGKFKKDVKHRTKSEQLHKAIREVKRKLAEIDRIVEYTSRMKQELSEDGGINYWKATQKNVATISEMVNQLNNKIKNLNQ